MASAVAEQMSDQGELSCVLIPTEGQNLLLPNVCVAEIVPWRRIKFLKEGPSWCLGFTGWRGLTIPVVSYSGFAEQQEHVPQARCLVVMNRARTSDSIPFYALAAQSLPYMVALTQDDLSSNSEPLGNADVMKVEMGSTIATNPDLTFIEQQVSALHKHSTAG